MKFHLTRVSSWPFLILFCAFLGNTDAILEAQSSRSDIRGYVRDIESGEALPYANISVQGTKRGAATNTDGYFVLVNEPVGQCTLSVNYIGYEQKHIAVSNRPGPSLPIIIELQSTVLELEGASVTGEIPILESSQEEISQVKIAPRLLATLPSIGEVDVFRTMQLLPGISAASDGESGLYVRGGTPDQNLVLFDGMTIYHVDHFFGFFSAFNADAIKDIQVFKGGFPAEYGGRLSSVVNLTGKTGNKNRTRFSAGANLLSAHANIEVPVFKNGTFLLAGRRSFTDFIQSPLYDKIYSLMTGEESGSGAVGGNVTGRGAGGGGFGGNMQSAEFKPAFYFHDLNAKFTYNPTEKDIVTLSFYSGKDHLDKSQDYSDVNLQFGDTGEEATLERTDYTQWGNTGFSGKWSRQLNDRIHTDVLFAWSEYFSEYERNANMNAPFTPDNDSVAVRRGFAIGTEEFNTIRDMSLRIDTDWHLTRGHTLEFGTWISRFNARYDQTLNDTLSIIDKNDFSNLYSFYIQDRVKLGISTLTLGLRAALYGLTDQIYWQPRVSFTHPLTSTLNFKGAWGHYYQFVNRITNENVLEGSRDFWILADGNLKPSFAEHSILGLSYEDKNYIFSAEAYYKNMDNLTEFTRRLTGRADHAEYFFRGNGYAKGIELLAQKKSGRLTGWLGYTLSKVEHTFPAFNNGDPFPADNDRRHELNLVTKYSWGKWTFAATGVYATGRAYTAPESQYFIPMLDGSSFSYIHVSDKNSYRLPDYQRIDLSVSRSFESDRWVTNLGLSVFNVLNHRNIWYREYDLETTPVTVTDAVMLGLTPTIYVQFNLK